MFPIFATINNGTGLVKRFILVFPQDLQRIRNELLGQPNAMSIVFYWPPLFNDFLRLSFQRWKLLDQRICTSRLLTNTRPWRRSASVSISTVCFFSTSISVFLSLNLDKQTVALDLLFFAFKKLLINLIL